MTDWYVRPSGGSYGAADGTSYATAWDGLTNITWGTGGVVAGDTLYVAGTHDETLIPTVDGSVGNEIAIRGDYAGDPGVINRNGGIGVSLVSDDYYIIRDISIKTQTANPAIYLQSCTNITLQDITIADTANVGISLHGGDAVSHLDYTFRRVSISSTGSKAIQWFVTPTNATNTLTNLTIDECTITAAVGEAIHLRTESDVNAASIMTNVAITNSNISGATTFGIRLYHGHENLADGKDLTVTGNTVTGNGSGTSGGGISIGGFGSSTGTWGKVTIANNNSSGNDGAVGGINLFYSQYARVYENTCSDNTADNGTSDANGILIDIGNQDVEVYQNECNNNVGNDQDNSGVGLMVLQNTRVNCFSNKGTGNRIGYWIGGASASTDCKMINNTMKDCVVDGLHVAVAQTSFEFKNNIAAGSDANTGYKVEDTVGTGSVDEDYNSFWNFANEVAGHTLGSNDLAVDPALDSELRPTNHDLVAAGVAVSGVETDYVGKLFWSPPAIGAYQVTSTTSTVWIPPPMSAAVPGK